MLRSSTRLLGYAAVVAAALTLAATGLLLVANSWVYRSARPYLYEAIDEVPGREVAIVPGIGARAGRVPPMLQGRLVAALALYRAHKVREILISGIGSGRADGNEVVTSRAWLVAHGVDPAQIRLDAAGFRTLDTMQRAARLGHVDNAIICTQKAYMSRAVFLARSAGIDAVGLVAVMRRPANEHTLRLETLKTALAFVDTYLLHTGPAVTGSSAIVAAEP